VRNCPGCGNEVAPLAKFCSECGTPLGMQARHGAPADEDEGELRQLTALFCDLVGSTELSTRMDAEEFGELIHRYLQRAAEVIHSYEGDVARYLGDGILVHFGWPEAHDDDAERAVRAALDIVAEIESMNGELPPETQLAVRVGIHTGPAMIGEIRGLPQQETISLGETLNIAARLQAVAPPNGVVMSGTTKGLVRGIFVIEDLPPQALRGIPEPVPACRVLQPTGVRSRLDAAQETLTPLVGRDAELSLLMRLWTRACPGSGHGVLVLGEAGVGKSRLVYELRQRVSAGPHTWLECRCSSYTRQSAFRPAVELIEQGLQLLPSDSPQDKRAKLERGLATAGVDWPNALALLAPLLSIPLEEDTAPLALSAELRRRRTIELLAAWVLALARPQPMVLFTEDLHWCDPSSLELFGALINRSVEAKLLIVATARPEFTPPWPEGSALTTLSVLPLGEHEAREMVTSLGGRRATSESVLGRIVSQTDGIPLYIEEIGRMALESAERGDPSLRGEEPASQDEVDIPTTLQASLMARLDRLSAAKRVAQRGSVIGREFSYRLLEEIAGLDPAMLRAGLERLVEDALLFKHGEPPDVGYTFKHALIQDAAYQSVLKRTRATLHGRIAEALERDSSAAPEVVARHFEAAGRIDSAVEHYRRAAEQMAESSGHREAIAHLRKAIELLATLPPSQARDEAETELQIELASSIIAIHGWADPEVRTAYQRAQELCEALGEDAPVGYAYTGLSIFYSNSAELRRGEELARRVLEIGEREDDDTLRLLARVQLGVPTCYMGRFGEALTHCRQALEIYDPERHRWIAFRFGTDHGVAAHGFASLSLCFLGDTDAALEHNRRGLELARSLGNPFNVAYALLAETTTHWLTGDTEAQGKVADQLLAVSEEQGFDIFTGIGHLCSAGARAVAEGDPTAIPEMVEGGMLAAQTGLRGAVPALLTILAEAQRAVGDRDAAAGTVEGALAIAAETEQRAWEPRLLCLKGDLILETAAGDAEQQATYDAAGLFRQALDIARTGGSRIDELRSATRLARLAQRREGIEEPAALLQSLCAGFSEDCSIGDLVEARSLLATLRSGEGGAGAEMSSAEAGRTKPSAP
jgi:class 3 adenylate cyclase/tetratricopeptide (TPR) repeat protein